MKPFAALLLALAALLPLPARAQHAAPPPAPPAAEARQFDFLLGAWELEVQPKVSSLVALLHGAPKLVGSWRAWKVFDGRGIEDELRIVDANGNPLTLNRALRVYAAGEQRWKVCGADGYRARTSEATGKLVDGEMRMEGHLTEAPGETVLTRTRYTEITPTSFRMVQDRSEDGGKTWEEGALTIVAKRVAATATPG